MSRRPNMKDSRPGTVKYRVGDILKRFAYTRNCDKDLYIKYLERFHPMYLKKGAIHSYIEVDALMKGKIPTHPTVCRYRRWYNQDGMYLPTKESVKKKRVAKSKAMLRSLGYGNSAAALKNRERPT